MIKKILMNIIKNLLVVIVTSLLCAECQVAYGNSVNWATDANSTKTGGGSGNGGSTGNPSLAFDGDESTCYKWSNVDKGSSTSSAWVKSEFLKPHAITKIRAVFNCSTGPMKSGTYLLEIYDSGVWKEVGGGNLTQSLQTVEYTNLDYKFAEQIKISITTTIYFPGVGIIVVTLPSDVCLYEFCAWGRDYVDAGLKIYNGSNVIKIGCKTLGATDKLRIRKENLTYGIPLLETNDADASPVRIYTGNETKALPKIE